MNIRQLRAFLEIVDTGTLAAASQRLHVSQPALSRQIDALEHELKVSLFERSGRTLRLTSEGEHLLRECRQVHADFLALSERARMLRSGTAGLLRIGASPTATEAFLAEFLVGYRERRPSVDIHLVEAAGLKLTSILKSGEVDLAIFPGGDPEFEQREHCPVCNLAIVPLSHRLADQKVIEIEDLAGEPLLLLSQDYVTRRWFDAACRSAGLHVQVRLESSASGAINALASNGFGIAIVNSTAPIVERRVRIVPVTHRGSLIGGWGSIAWRRDTFQPLYARAFVDEFVASFAEDYPYARLIKSLPPLPRLRRHAAA